MSTSQKDDNLSELTFEESFKRLEEVVKKLESSESSLEKAISYYELGVKLKNNCDEKLRQAELKIQKVINTNQLTTYKDE